MDAIHYSSSQTNWETPDKVFRPIDDIFCFTLDVAASAENAVCNNYITVTDNALIQDWSGRCWMNPPYGRGIKAWVKKAHDEVLAKHASVVVGLLPARTDTVWFQDYCAQYLHRFLRGRIKFEIDGQPMLDKKGNPMSAPFPSVLVYFGL